MKRRDLVVLSSAAAIAWPLLGRTQGRPLPRVGVLALQDPEPFWSAFRVGLRQLGYVEGKNIYVELRTVDGARVSLDAEAIDLVRNNFDVIATIQNAPVVAAKRATKDIPIVMITSGDPIASGLVSNLARPDGNVTGMSGAAPTGKAVEVLREMLPNLRRIGVLLHQPNPAFGKAMLNDVERVAGTLRLTVVPIWIGVDNNLDLGFRDATKERIDAVVFQGSLPAAAADLAVHYRVPAAGSSSRFSGTSVLVNYAQNADDVSHKAATYVDRILKGAKPADLPIEEPTKFDLIVNQRTARALGITVPRSVLLRATSIIA